MPTTWIDNPMSSTTLTGRLAFLREAEKLKDVLRSAHTSSGRPESTAEHSWRLCLMAIVFADQLPALDMLKVLKLCVIHDLGEALHGDIPAVSQADHPDKSEQERADLLELTRSLDAPIQAEILALWEEYEHASSEEALAVKALDKLETLLQHTQGDNPSDFDYAFNLGYGRKYTNASPLFQNLRALIDEDTRRLVANTGSNPENAMILRPETLADCPAIELLTAAAFAHAPHSSHTEHFIVNALRRAGQLSVSLVAEEAGHIIGHVALSPVSLSDGSTGWYGLGPISVAPERHGQGIGSQLMHAALQALQALGAAGCVVLGDPGYYGRFGFVVRPELVLPGVPPEYFQARSYTSRWPQAQVSYHPAFEATS
ncbi:5'-deoxynucleotidase [Pseudomonas wadenswilerensis]|uniref:5'-deoxynucleotidase n=2 Tax=Pseudomonas TaxID=286 RepID=A0A380SZ73_9PSED|nr:HD domain-containing protein 2 [Pseudomonas wadenswilerensis]